MVLCLGVMSATTASAQNPKSIGSFGNWQALTFDEEGKQGCYVISEPDRKEGAYSSRGKVYALVTHRPEDKQVDVVTIIAGYTFKDSSEVTVEIGDAKFALFTSEGTAWAPDEEGDHNLVEAMKQGTGMVVRGVSSRGTETTDTYSLTGFTKAYNAIRQACGLTR
ncbi:MAG: invasion associated locus B family protein [Dongiaceae bacterium]